MSFDRVIQVGGEDAYPLDVVEIQELTVALFLIWNTLGDDYSYQREIEGTILQNWAKKHGIGEAKAVDAMQACKDQLLNHCWAHYIHCRGYNAEGYFSALMMNPDSANVRNSVNTMLAQRPFEEGPNRDE